MSIFLDPLAPKLRDQELAASFVSRLAAWLRYTSARVFCFDFGLNFDRISAGDAEQFHDLALLTGTSVGALSLGPVLSKSTFRFSGEVLSSVYMDRLDLWICPECVAEDIAAAPHLPPEASIAVRRDNIIRAIGSCSKHRRTFVFVGRNVRRYGRHDTSLMAMDIPNRLPAILAASTPTRPSSGDEYIWNRFDGAPTAFPLLAPMPLNRALIIASRFGNWTQSGDRDNLRDMSRLDFNRVLSIGLDLLAGGREAMTDELNRQLSEIDFFNAAPVGQAMYKIRRMLFHYRPDPLFLPLQEMMDDAVAHCAYVKNSVEVGENRWTAITSLSVELGHAPYILRKFANLAGALHPSKPTWLNRQKLLSWMNLESGLVSTSEVIRNLGLTDGQMELLISHGRLIPVLPRQHKKGAYTWLRRGHVDAMLASLQTAEVLETIPNGKATVRSMVSRAKGSFLTLHDAIVDGTLSVTQLAGKKPYASILVDVEEAHNLLAHSAGGVHRQVTSLPDSSSPNPWELTPRRDIT